MVSQGCRGLHDSAHHPFWSSLPLSCRSPVSASPLFHWRKQRLQLPMKTFSIVSSLSTCCEISQQCYIFSVFGSPMCSKTNQSFWSDFSYLQSWEIFLSYFLHDFLSFLSSFLLDLLLLYSWKYLLFSFSFLFSPWVIFSTLFSKPSIKFSFLQRKLKLPRSFLLCWFLIIISFSGFIFETFSSIFLSLLIMFGFCFSFLHFPLHCLYFTLTDFCFRLSQQRFFWVTLGLLFLLQSKARKNSLEVFCA